jgi:hypothetical protein
MCSINNVLLPIFATEIWGKISVVRVPEQMFAQRLLFCLPVINIKSGFPHEK